MVGFEVGSVRGLRAVALALVVVWWAGCGGVPAPVVDPEVAARQEARFLEPFQIERAIVADRLELVMTANFYDELILPALRPGLQDEERTTRDDGGTEVVYRNRSVDSQLRLSIGNTRMVVYQEARIVVVGGRSAYRLEATLEGGVTAETVAVVEAGERTDCRQVQFVDGVFRCVR